MITRTIPEWRGRTDDSMPPPTVRLRIFERTGGCCYICSQRLRAGRWHADHIKPLWDGGENVEGNLAPVCEACHSTKTGEEAAQRAEGRRHRMKQAGISKPKRPIPGSKASGWKRKVSGEWERR